MKFTEARKPKDMEYDNIWDAVYDELSTDNAHEATQRKIASSDVKNSNRFRFDDENAFDRNDGPQDSKHKDVRNAWPTEDGFKLKPKDLDQEDFAYRVADMYGCKVEPKDGYLYIHCPLEESLNESMDQDKLNSMVYDSLSDIMFKTGSDKDGMDKALEWFDLHFYDDFDESLTEEKDLSKVSGTISNVLSEDDGWKYCDTVSDMLDYVKSVLDENGIDTPASKRLVANIAKKRTTSDAMFVIYNSILAGTGNSVISDKKKYESTNIISKNNINESLMKILNK